MNINLQNSRATVDILFSEIVEYKEIENQGLHLRKISDMEEKFNIIEKRIKNMEDRIKLYCFRHHIFNSILDV
jgi:hypothetical protein